jgi:hypothetical protein
VRSQIAGLDRADTLKLVSICAGHIDPSEIKRVIDIIYDDEGFRKLKSSGGESGESLFSLVKDPKVARLALVPALSHAHNLGIDRSEIMEVIGSDQVDESFEEEYVEDSESWEEGHGAAERMIKGLGGSARNPHAEGSQEYAEFEAGFKAGLKAYGSF